jgi:hypothetical protein
MTDELDGGYEQRHYRCEMCGVSYDDPGAAIECCADPDEWPGATDAVRDPRDPLGEALEDSDD